MTEVEAFERNRGRLVAVAYGMLGSHAEAEDVVQDAWLRWSEADRSEVENPAAYLTRVVTRLAIDRLRSARNRRETYVGPWLPEPIVVDLDADPGETVAEAERISMALLTALERLNPIERAVFLLREVFDHDYAEIAPIVMRSPEACRQIASRARDRVGDPTRARPLDPERDRELVAGLLAAMAGGDLDALVSRLAADVVLWSDGGSARRAARHPVLGAARVATFLASITRRGMEEGGHARIVRANGAPAILLLLGEEVYGVMTLDLVDDVVTAIRAVVNPAKLTRVHP